MLIADVNIFVGAHRSVITEHEDYRRWLEDQLVGDETFGVSELVLSAFIRLVTNHRVFRCRHRWTKHWHSAMRFVDHRQR